MKTGFKISYYKLGGPALPVDKKMEEIYFLFFSLTPPGHPWVSTKNFSPIGPAVLPAIDNIVHFHFVSYVR